MKNSQDTARKLTGAAGIIMFATILSRISGYLRTLVINTTMLPTGHSDEFLLAFTLPDLVYNLLAGGAIAAAMIPILSSFLAKDEEDKGWKAVSTFMNVTIIVMVILEIIFFAFTNNLLGILAGGYSDGGTGNKDLLIRLTRILLLSAPFMMMAGQFNGILNSYKRFAVASFGPVIYNICTIISISVFGSNSVELAAWGVVFSAVVFFIIQFIGTFRHFVHYRPRLYLRNPIFKKLVVLAIPSLLSSSIMEINSMITRGFATYFSEGMLTLLYSANRTWQLPLGIFAQSIGIALLPTLSEHHASESYDEFKKILYKGLNVVFLLSLPTSVIMMILNQDITRVMFKWGSFSESQVFHGGVALLGYSSALVFASMMALMIRAFYAIHDTKVPLVSGIVGIIANFAFSFYFGRFTGIGIAGIALAYSIASFINMMILFLVFKKRTGIDVISDNFKYIVKASLAAIPAGLVTYGLNLLIRPDINSKLSQLITVSIPLAGGMGVFWILLVRLKIPEVAYINNLVLTRLHIRRPGKK